MSREAKRLSRAEVPKEETWDLTDLFTTHKEWEQELNAIQTDVSEVIQFQGQLTANAKTLLKGLQAEENFQKRLIRAATYANLKSSADGSDPDNQADAAKVSAVLADIGAKLAFVENELLMLSEATLTQFINEEPDLAVYRKMVQDILAKKPFTLSPDTEKTLAALADVHSAPQKIYERNKTADMTFEPIKDRDGNKMPMSAALFEDSYEMSSDTHVRRQAYDSFVSTLNQYKNTQAAVYATEVTKQVTTARLRGYDSVTDMLLQPQQVSREMYHNQLDIIQQELAPHMRRFAKLKQEKLGLSDMRFCDLKAPLDPEFNPETSYQEATDMISEALQIMGPEYSAIINKGITERWIDRADNIGKKTGAFCSSPYGVHPYVLITWTNSIRGAFMLAHELGHAGHFYLAGSNQSLVNTRPSTYFIEAPSTLNELLLADNLLAQTDDKRRKRWVISSLLSTYYHNFVTHLLEGEFQRRVYDLAETGTPLTADVLCKQKKETLENFWGDAAVIDDDAGLTWMRQPHYYMGLYPYTYSAGLTISTAMAGQIRHEGQPAVDRWLSVLKDGGTRTPSELAQKAGVDMTNPDAIKEAVAYVGQLIDELEKTYD
ncbi:oligoendopeptidase F [Barrientosiimonas marina]|uniref:Oligopeptidase F n=1 Tax=Lentibacillus kimchii TaxID=1542911 RepID=A0ABW2UQS3_9BACI